jgi:hypothetical protein
MSFVEISARLTTPQVNGRGPTQEASAASDVTPAERLEARSPASSRSPVSSGGTAVAPSRFSLKSERAAMA